MAVPAASWDHWDDVTPGFEILSRVTPLAPSSRRKGRKGNPQTTGVGQIRSVRCYIRVSTEEQATFGYSLDAQRQRLEEEQARRGWRCAGWYVEEGRSAKNTNRPELRRMLSELQPGEIVMVLKLDRLTRSVRDLDELLRTFEEKKVLFQSASENFETVTASGRLFVRLVAEIAQWEREVIAERSAMGKRQKVENGEWQGGPVPFGYLAAPSGKMKGKKELLKLIPDPETAHLVAEVFDLYRSGLGVRAICIHLNEVRRAGTKKGAKWRSTSLIRVLQNPIYAGYVHHGERSKHGHETMWKRGSHQALVSEETFAAVQRAYELRENTAPRHATGQYPLTGVAYCGVCGGKVHILSRTKQGSYSYRCGNYMNGTGCGGSNERSLVSASGRIVEENLLATMEKLARPEGLDRYFTQLNQKQRDGEDQIETEVRRLEDQIARAQRAIKAWDTTLEESRSSAQPLSYDEYLEKVEPHREAIAEAEALLVAARKKPTPPVREVLASAATDLRRAWEHLKPPERKALLQQFCDAFRVRILVYPDRQVELAPAPE